MIRQFENRLIGVVLAGGLSRRMGQDKSLMLYRDEALIKYSIDILTPYCSEVLLSSNTKFHDKFGLTRIEDLHKEIGPMGGLYSILKQNKAEYYLCLPCDSPMVKPEFIEQLINQIDDNFQAIVPIHEHHIEPLFAIYHHSISEVLELCISKNNYKMMNLLNQVQSKYIPINEESYFMNINTPEDYQRLINKSE
ncbi:MAG: molybdenum cofactor guanylyltransferase [Bacteroidales bacterium]|nr:molybdenum cofactor guanylyltransferase [Bacteroidales bacterium]